MAKFANDLFMDAAFDWLSTSAVRLAVCSTEPANWAAISGVTLAEATITSGDFTKANGDTDGRKVTIAAQSGITIDSSGDAQHLVLHDNVSLMMYITTSTTLTLTSGGGNTVSTPAWDIEISDPA